jgi:hypothetical protein
LSELPHYEAIVERDGDVIIERYRVKTVGKYHIEVVPMAVNYRIHTVRVDGGKYAWSERYWCYAGRNRLTFVAAMLAAHAWDGAPDSEPVGWVKSWDGRRNGERPALPLD